MEALRGDLTLVGWGYARNDLPEGFVTAVQVDCPADFDVEGTVNTLDVLAFWSAWNAGC